MIAFKGVKKCGFTLGDDPLLQPALFPMSEPKATHGAVGFKAGRSCRDLIQPVKENAVSFFGRWRGARVFHCLLRAQTCRTEPLVLAGALPPPRQPLHYAEGSKGFVPMPLTALQGHEFIPILTEFCRPCSVGQYLEKCKFQNIVQVE